MKCQLFYGRRNADPAGALQKSLLETLDRGSAKVYLILPEQATFRREVEIAANRGNHDLWNLEITSFRRLADRFLPGEVLDPLGRRLLIYDILSVAGESMKALKPQRITVGFVDDISDVLKEVSMNGISTEALFALAAVFAQRDTAGDLGDKLYDIALVQQAMEERGLTDENGRLFGLAEAIRKEKLFADTYFFFDEFFDFTAAEYQVIAALAEVGANLSFAFLSDRSDGVFAKTNDAISRIIAIAGEASLSLELTPVAGTEEDTALAFLERNYFLPQSPPVFCGAAAGITVVAAENKRAEVRSVARQISDLLARGRRPGEIGVCFRNISGYEKYIEDIFAAYGIRCHVDAPTSLLQHPLFRYGLGLFRLAAEKWSFPALFSLLKSGFFPIDSEACDIFENYCLAHAIKGRRFYQPEPWTYKDEREGEDPEAVNLIRQGILEVLLPFTEEIQKEDTPQNYGRILWQFLEACGCDKTIDIWRRQEEARGAMTKSAELTAGTQAFATMLDQLCAAFPQRSFGLAEFMELLKMGAAAMTVRTIPAELDTVEISVIGASRPERKPVVFLCGVNEGVLPAGVSDGGFLNIADRSLLKEQENGWVQDKTFFYESEDLLVYQALTQAEESLRISYITGGDEEKVYPSPLIARLQKLFGGLPLSHVADDVTGEGIFGSLEEVLYALPLSLREKEVSGWEDVQSLLLTEESTASRTETLLTSLAYDGRSKPLSPSVLGHYPGKNLSLSVSSLELFRRCPFSYFARYGLKLKERKILQFAAPDLGNIFHETLCELMEMMKAGNVPWAELRSFATDKIDGMVAEKLQTLSAGNLFPEEHLNYIRFILGENLRFLIDMMAIQAESGDQFVPALWEVPFGRHGGIPGYAVSVDDGAHRIDLNGVIDRVDIADKDGKRYFRIVDYKSSGKELGLDDIYYGISPQLPVYSMVLDRKKDVQPAGIFYQSMKDVMLREDQALSDDQLRAKLSEEMALKGYIIGDGVSEKCFAPSKKTEQISVGEYDLVRRHTERQIAAVGKEIFHGCTEIHPYMRNNYSSCSFCPYNPVCGYEPELMGKEEVLPSLKDTVVKGLMLREEQPETTDTTTDGKEDEQ